MAVAAVAGLTSAIGAAAAKLTIFGLTGWLAAGAAFAIGAGLSVVSRALMPKPDIGQQMTGLTTTVREPASSRKIIYGRARVGGSIVYMDSTGNDNKYFHMVIAIAGHEIDAFEEIYFNDTKVWDGGSFVGSWGTYVYFGLHDGSQTTADSTLVSQSTQWTTAHKLLDTAYIYAKLEYDAEQFANGLPNISAVIRGKKVYNPSTSSTAWSQNPALIVRDYLLDSKYGLAESSSNINSTALSAAQTICDQDVSLEAGGTQKRFTCDGVLDTANSRQNNIESLLSSMVGKLIHSGGEYFISASAYVTPTVTIDESLMVGAISVKTKQSRRSIYNGVKGVFNSEQDNYITSDYPPVISSTYSAADGDPIYLDMPLPFTTNHVRAQRIAKRILLQSRQQTQITVPCNLAALKFKAGDTIMITNAKIGWSAKIFEVTGYSLDFSASGEIIVNVDALETASSIYDWTSSEEEDYLSGGEVDLYDGRTVAAPTQFAGTASTAVNLDGTVVPQIVSTWTASVDAFVVKYDYQWSIDNNNWNTVDAEGTQFTISPTIGGATYYTRVRAVNDIGVRSAFVTANITAIGDNTAPALPTSVSATAGYKSISLEWTNPSDKDFSNVEVYRATSSGGTYSVVASVGSGFGANAEFLNGGVSNSTTYYYKLKSVDYSGNKSAFTGVVSATTDAEVSGDDGKSVFNAPIFKRDTSAPSAPSGGTFNFGTNVLTPPSGWSTTVPSGTDPIYQANFQFSISGDTGTVTAGTWSTPVVIAENGNDGTDGLSTFTYPVYKRDTSEPSTPSGGSYNFTNNSITAPSGWYTAPPSGNDPLYVSIAKAQISGATGTDTSIVYSGVELLVKNGTDGVVGAAGVRSADGYLYYSVSQANAPATPSATSYNFVTGSFGGLTANWSTTPPTNTGGDAKYWATYWHVTEATFDGTQTRTFNTPFNSIQFDGLVTFTNLNSELGNASSTEITTINGGLLKTGTIDVSQVNISGTTQSNFNLQSAASGSRMVLTNDTIEIYDGSTLRVKLGNLA